MLSFLLVNSSKYCSLIGQDWAGGWTAGGEEASQATPGSQHRHSAQSLQQGTGNVSHGRHACCGASLHLWIHLLPQDRDHRYDSCAQTILESNLMFCAAYPPSFDLVSALEEQSQHPSWGRVVSYLLSSGRVSHPQGGKDVGDHPPITPMRAAPRDEVKIVF